MKRTRNKALSLLLALLLALSLLPGTALAASTISSVSITLDAPVAGSSPDYTAVFPSGAPYYSDAYNFGYMQNDIMWYDLTTNKNVVPGSGVLQSGHVYRVDIYLTAQTGYAFAEGAAATVNGQTAGASTFDDQLLVSYTFPALPESISSVSITLDAPAVGASPDYTAQFPAGAPYYTLIFSGSVIKNDICWRDETTGTDLYAASGVFQAGHSYKVTVSLHPQEGYAFTSGTTATVNGQSAAASVIGDQLEVIYTFPVLPGPIPSASVTLDAPAVGASPDYTAVFPYCAPYYSDDYSDDVFRNDIGWRDLTANTDVDPESDVFQAGHQYEVNVYLTAQEGVFFTGSTTATLNGQAAEVRMAVNQLWITYTFPVLTAAIPSVSVTLDAPAVGAHPDYTAVFPSGAPYYSDANNYGYFRNDIEWWDATEGVRLDPETGVFQAGREYRADVYLTEQSGYYFTPNTTATLNGQPVQISDQGYGQILVSYTFPPLTALIPSVSITLDAPAVGASPDYDAVFPSGAPYYSADYTTGNYRNDIFWSGSRSASSVNFHVISPYDTFEAGYWYRVTVYLTARDGYAFTDNTTATLNGQSAEASMYSLYQDQLMVTYTFPALVSPKPGDITSVTATASAGKITVTWPAAEFASRYVVARQVSGSTSWTALDSNVTATSYVDGTAAAGTAYRYRVRAYNDQGSGAAADSAFVTALAPKPGDIASVTATASAGKITVTWPAAEFAARYAVARQTYGSSTWKSLTSSATETTFVDSTAVDGTRYRYRVRAYNAQGSGGAADSSYVTATAAKPGDISSVTAAASAGKITVTWPAAEFAARYAVARQTYGSTSWKSLTTTATETSFTDSTAVAGTKYRYRVRAYNAQGSGGAADSSYVTALAAKPGDITSVTAAASAGKITVSWPAADYAARYVVARQTYGTTTWKSLTSSATETTFTDSTAVAGTQYRYRVRAYNDAGSGAAADSAYVTALAAPTAPPANIASVTATASTGKITVSWPAADYASRYVVARQASGASSWTVLSSDVTATSYVDSTVQAGTQYRYRVRAYNDLGSGAAANSAYVTAR